MRKVVEDLPLPNSDLKSGYVRFCSRTIGEVNSQSVNDDTDRLFAFLWDERDGDEK